MLAGPGTTPPRVAYAVSKRVGGAVTRNRVRRRLRAAVRDNLPHLRPGAAYLVGAGAGADRVGFDELEAAVHTLVGQTTKSAPSGTSR